MNKNEKRWIVLLVAVVIIAIVLFVALGMSKNKSNEGGQTGGSNNNGAENVVDNTYSTQLDDGTRLNKSTNFNSTKTYGNLEISNIQFTSKDGKSTLLADVKNTGTTTHEPEIVKIVLLDENGNTVTELKPAIEKIEPGETAQINSSISADVANVKDFRIEAAN